MFERMLDHRTSTFCSASTIRKRALPIRAAIWSSPANRRIFRLSLWGAPYRSLRFQHETVDREWHQRVAVVNYPDEAVPYTRVTEYKHLTGQQCERSSITYEFPAEGGPLLSNPRDENQALFKRYEALAVAEHDVTFCRAASDISLLQHGPDRRPDVVSLSSARGEARHRSRKGTEAAFGTSAITPAPDPGRAPSRPRRPM